MTTQSNNRARSCSSSFNMLRILCKQNINYLNVCHINAQSLNNKIDEFRYLFAASNIDVICVSETWLRPSQLNDSVHLNNYSIFRGDRQNHAGGVAMYVRAGIRCNLICKSQPEDPLEFVFVEISNSHWKILIACVYGPYSNTDIVDLLEKIHELSLNYKDIIICGDFNNNVLCDANFTEDMEGLGLYLVNATTPTHFTRSSSTLLDLFLVNNGSNI